jgi:hypothetical protein
VPFTPIVCGLLLAFPFTVTVALTAPWIVGAKPILTEHLPLGPTKPLQLVEAENSFDPATVAPSKVTAVPVFLFAVLISFTTLLLLFPILTVPKFIELRDVETTADTLGAGVTVEVGVGASGGLNVGAGVGGTVGAGVAVELGVGTSGSLGVGVGVGGTVGAGVAVELGVGVSGGLGVTVGVGVAVGVDVGAPSA